MWERSQGTAFISLSLFPSPCAFRRRQTATFAVRYEERFCEVTHHLLVLSDLLEQNGYSSTAFCYISDQSLQRISPRATLTLFIADLHTHPCLQKRLHPSFTRVWVGQTMIPQHICVGLRYLFCVCAICRRIFLFTNLQFTTGIGKMLCTQQALTSKSTLSLNNQ